MLQKNLGHSRPKISFREFDMRKKSTASLLSNFDGEHVSYARYAEYENAYYTGYFTSRPALKRYVRILSGYYLV